MKLRNLPTYFSVMAICLGIIFSTLEVYAEDVNTPIVVNSPQPELQKEVALPEPKRSFLPLSIRIPVSTVKKIANRALPSEFKQNGKRLDCASFWKNCSMDLLVRRNGDIILNVSGKQLNAVLPLSVHIRIDWWKGNWTHSHESADADININIISPLELNKNWQIVSKTQLNSQVNRADLGNVGKVIKLLNKIGVNIDIHREIQKFLQPDLNKLAVLIDRELAKIDIKKEVIPIWNDLHKPVELTKNPPLWLSTQLDQVYFAGLHGSGGEIKLDLAVSGKLDGQMGGDRLQSLKNVPLPHLTLQNPPSKNFDINLHLTVQNYELQKQLISHLKNKRFKMKKEPPQEAIIDLQKIYGNGNQLIAETKFKTVYEGTDTVLVEGNLFMNGQPTWNNNEKQLEVKQFTVILNNVFMKNNLVSIKNLEMFTKKPLVFSLKKEIEQAKKALKKQINRKIFEDKKIGSFYLKGHVNEPEVKGIYIQKEQILVLLNATGQMEIVQK